MSKTYIKVNQEAGSEFFSKAHDGPVIMLNMLRFRKFADYSSFPNLGPKKEISGKEAYNIYIFKVSPMLAKIGSRVIFMGNGDRFLIGPPTENWDAVILMKYLNVNDFLNFASTPEYLAISGHRTAALEDSRLLPLFEGNLL